MPWVRGAGGKRRPEGGKGSLFRTCCCWRCSLRPSLSARLPLPLPMDPLMRTRCFGAFSEWAADSDALLRKATGGKGGKGGWIRRLEGSEALVAWNECCRGE